MSSKIKNIIIFIVIATLIILAYVFLIKKSPEEQNLISSLPASNNIVLPTANVLDQNSLIAQDLLSVLLSVKSIKLDDTIFSDEAFINLKDSSISLNPLGDEGRPNPFAPIGFEAFSVPVIPPPVVPIVPPPVCTLPQVLNTSTNTCVTPPPKP